MLDRESIKRVLTNAIFTLEWIARFTPSGTDDKIVAYFKQLAAQDWFIDLLALIFNRVEQGKVGQPVELESVIAAMKEN